MKVQLTHNQQGFAHLVAFLLVAVALAAGVVSYKVVASNHPVVATTASVNSVPKAIQNKQDISQAQAALSNTDVDSSLNPDQFDADISALL